MTQPLPHSSDDAIPNYDAVWVTLNGERVGVLTFDGELVPKDGAAGEVVTSDVFPIDAKPGDVVGFDRDRPWVLVPPEAKPRAPKLRTGSLPLREPITGICGSFLNSAPVAIAAEAHGADDRLRRVIENMGRLPS